MGFSLENHLFLVNAHSQPWRFGRIMYSIVYSLSKHLLSATLCTRRWAKYWRYRDAKCFALHSSHSSEQVF